ncbi:MAG: CRTAC1 family protein [Pirellulaceae bacterium]|nr:CRTAC1 family protein [Pirellulaceae bacterium]
MPPQFADIAAAAGVEFRFHNDIVPDRFLLPEIMGGGAAWIDYDNDGWWDLCLANGSVIEDPDQSPHVNRLFRNLGGNRFEEVSIETGTTDRGYGQGLAVGDYNADGFADLFVANYGANALYRNNGDGTFDDVTASAGVAGNVWSSGAMWVDLNRDGLLDVYVANYLNITLEISELERQGTKDPDVYSGPGKFESVADLAYLNLGNGSFREASDELGLRPPQGKGLGLAAVDFDDDLSFEIYVANDMVPNFLFAYDAEKGRYVNKARLAGCDVGGDGANEASMGIALADFNHNGMCDVLLTHYYQMKNTLYNNNGDLLFSDDSRISGIANTSNDFIGFGTASIDFDRDGWPDLFVSNGHVRGPRFPPFELTAQILWNDKGFFRDVSATAGRYFQTQVVGRSAAPCDLDNDGDVDMGVTHVIAPFALLNNNTAVSRPFIGLDLRPANRGSLAGGRVIITAGEQRLVHHLSAGGSYLCSPDPRVVLAVGDHQGGIDVELHWPSGAVEQFPELPPNKYWLIREGAPRLTASPDAS